MSDHGFDIDLVLEPRRQARRAWIVAAASLFVTLALAATLWVMLPLKQTEVFTILVDRNTGDAERIMQVQPLGIQDEEAVKQALLVGYITSRESYLKAGAQERLEGVLRMSQGSAAKSLTRLWTNSDANRDYPPRLYGSNAEISVKVKTITFLKPLVAQVRFEKTLRRPQETPVTRAFVATVGFEFNPREERTLELVWENPLGFEVLSYRVDAETLDGELN